MEKKLFFDSLRKGIQQRMELNPSPLTDKEIAALENLVSRREELYKLAWVSAIPGPLPIALFSKGLVIGSIEDTKKTSLSHWREPCYSGER